MIRSNRPVCLPRSVAVIVMLAIGSLVAACAPTSGPLGTPATPAITEQPSVEIPSEDSTPGIPRPSDQPPSTAGPSTAPSGSGPVASPAPTGAPTATPKVTTAPTPAPSDTTIVRAYFVLGSFTNNAGLAPVLREVPETKAVATAAMNALLAGPNSTELGARPAFYTTIPDGTRLLDLSISNGVATVDLTKEFASGGGSASLLGRLAQVVYTLTQFSTVDTVLFQLDGQPVTVFGGEGVILDHPVGRSDFYDQVPAIFIDRPAWNAALGNPGVVNGMANVFEATFRVQLRNAAGTTVVNKQVMATCGTGCWGTWKTTLSYTITKAQWGTLRVHTLSARDGTPENITEYPVWLTPAG